MTNSTAEVTSNPEKPLLEMRSIIKHFRGVLALSAVNFEVGQDEAVALDVIRRDEIKWLHLPGMRSN